MNGEASSAATASEPDNARTKRPVSRAAGNGRCTKTIHSTSISAIEKMVRGTSGGTEEEKWPDHGCEDEAAVRDPLRQKLDRVDDGGQKKQATVACGK